MNDQELQAYPAFAHQLAALRARMAREEAELFGPVLRRLRAPDPELAIRRGPAAFVPEWRAPGGTGRFIGDHGIDFRRASPITAERRQSDNARVPHIDISHVVRPMVPRSKDGKTHHRYPAVGGVGAGHHDYVIEGALSYARHYDYIVRQAGGRDPDDPIPPMDILDFEEAHRTENILAVISNIGVTRERQRSLFAAAERCERQARGGSLTVSTKHAALWRVAAAEPDAPKWVEEASRRLDVAEAMLLTPSRRTKPAEKDVSLCRVDLKQAYDRLVEADRIFGKRSPALPMFVQGRSGRIQTRFVLELPRNLDVQSQHEIVQRFGDRLAVDGWMYAAAIHRPDPHNEQSNIHAHVDAYDRPCVWLDDHGCWDFEYRERKRNGKWTYPYRQNKISVARGEADGPSGRSVASAYYKGLRADYVAIANDVIDGREGNPRYVTGTYRQNGIRLTPLEHLGNRTITSEKRGVVTPAGTRNALTLFGDRLRQVRFDLTIARRELHARARATIAAAKTASAQRATREWRREGAAALFRGAQAAVMEIAGSLLRSRAEAVIAHQRGEDQAPARRKREQESVAEARAWIAEVDALMPQPHDRNAEARIVARHHAAAASARDRAASHDRNALPNFTYRARFSHDVSVDADYRDATRGRLFDWLDRNAPDQAALILTDGEASTGPGVPKAIDRLFRLFIADRAVQERLHREKLSRQLRAIVADPGLAGAVDTKTQRSSDSDVPDQSGMGGIGSKEPVEPDAARLSRQRRGILAQADRLTGSSQVGQHPVASKTPGNRPAPGSATPPHREVPDYRADPTRVATIAGLVRDLEQIGHLPLIPYRNEDGRRGHRFCIDLDLGDPLDSRLPAFRTAARFEDDPAIQAVYARQHQRTLRDAELALRGARGGERDRVRAGIFDDLEPAGAGLAHAMALLRETGDLTDLVQRMENHWARSDALRRDGTPGIGNPSESKADPTARSSTRDADNHRTPAVEPDGAAAGGKAGGIGH